jgi:hypothetical protein
MQFATTDTSCDLEICWDWKEGQENIFEPYTDCSDGMIKKQYPQGEDPYPGTELIIKIKGEFNGGCYPSSYYYRELIAIQSFGQAGLSKIRLNKEYGAFQSCENLTKVSSIDIPDPTKLSMYCLFTDATKFNDSIERWDVSNISSMEKLFWTNKIKPPYVICEFNQPLNKWDVSNVTSMRDMLGYTYYNYPLDRWNVSNVTDMAGMFGKTSFKRSLTRWSVLVSNVTDMSVMFNDAKNFNQDLSSWNVNDGTNIESIFKGAGLILDYQKEHVMHSEDNLCKIYNSQTWPDDIRTEMEKLIPDIKCINN